MFKDSLGELDFLFLPLTFPLLFVSNNEALFYKIMTTAKHYFRWQMGLAERLSQHSPSCCTTCAPVLGFRQPVTAMTHVAIGPVFEGRNSINKSRPSTRYSMSQQRHGGRRWTICSFLCRTPPVTYQSLLLMSNILGYDSYSLNHLLWLYVMKP